MKYTQKTFTQNGINAFSRALSQQKPVHMDNVITDNLPTDSFSNVSLLTLSSFPNANNYPVNYSNMDDDSLTVDTVISNEGFTSTYNVNEIGLTGHVDGDSNETLLAILIADEPFYLPPQSNGDTPIHLIPNITIPLSNSDMQQVSVPVANDVYIAQQDLDKLVRQNGYLKLSDTDSRYVKQSDFNNEVDNAVNNKANQSDIDQAFNQTNNEIDTKANKTDLSTLQDNINNDVQPKLNNKYDKYEVDNKINGLKSEYHTDGQIQNGYNLNGYTWNGEFLLFDVDINTLVGNDGLPKDYTNFYGILKVEQMSDFPRQTLTDNIGNEWYKYNGNGSIWQQIAYQSYVDSSSKQVLNQSILHSDQNLQNANQHSDSNYSDLSNKNNILSNDYYTKLNARPNLVEGSSKWQTTSVQGIHSYVYHNVHLQGGKWYMAYVEAYMDNGSDLQVETQFSINQWWLPLNSGTGTSYDSNNPIVLWGSAYVSNDMDVDVGFIQNNSTGNLHYRKYRLIEIDSNHNNDIEQIPTFEDAQRQRHIMLSATTDDLDNAKSDLQNKTNDLSNQLNSHFGTGEIKNGYNLNTYTWDGSFYLNGVDIDTLTGHDGIAPGYNGFYGKMLVDSRNGYVFQTLYDNTNNMWYRYVGNGVQWQHVAKQSDIDNLGTDSTNKFNYMNTIKANTSDMNDHIQGAFNQANSYTDQRHDNLNYAKADKYNTYTKDDTDTRIAWAKAELNNNKQDKSDTNNKYAYLANTKEDQSDATNKFNWMNTVKANTDDMNSHIQGAFNQANAHTDDVANSKQDKPGVGTVENGYNLDGFTWYGNFGLFDVNLATLGANLGLNMNYAGFYGYLAVRPNYNAVYQYLYDNMGNRWYRTTGQAWHQTATEDDIASIKANAWRELKVDGQTASSNPFSNYVLCKINWSTNQALLMGMVSFADIYGGTATVTIHSSNDFNFNGYASYAGHDGDGGNMNYESSNVVSNGNIQISTNSGVGGTIQFGDQYTNPIGVASITPK